MKKTKQWSFVLYALLAFACLGISTALAADSTVVTPPAGGTPGPALQLQSLFLLIIPVLVPLLIAFGKWAIPVVPAWALPIIAPALGALTDWLISLAAGTSASPAIGALLGSAGVGFREIKDQVQYRIKEGKPTVPLILLFGALSLGLTGCTTTGPDGTKVPDPVQTQQVKDALQPLVRIPVRRIIMNSPQHSDEIAKYFRATGGVFCNMVIEKQFDPTTMTRLLQAVAVPANGISNSDVQALLDFKVALENLYRIYWNDRLRASLPPDGWMAAVSEFFCTAIGNGLIDAGKPGIVPVP